jgi:hypothetical protein
VGPFVSSWAHEWRPRPLSQHFLTRSRVPCALQDYASPVHNLEADHTLPASAVVAVIRLCPATALGAMTMQHAPMHMPGSPARGVIHQAICHSCKKGSCRTRILVLRILTWHSCQLSVGCGKRSVHMPDSTVAVFGKVATLGLQQVPPCTRPD